MTRSLASEVVLVSGGAHRLGEAIVRAVAAAGARVVVHYHRSEGAAQRLVAELGEGTAIAAAADLSTATGPRTLLRAAAQREFEVTAIVHSAANFVAADPLALDAAGWDEVFALNLRAFYLLAQALVRERRGRGGQLLAVSDAGAIEHWTRHLAHGVSKAALLALVNSLAKALAPGYRVNAVVPGPVLPPAGTSAEETRRIAARTLLQRIGTPEDVAEAAAFLLGNPFCTGTTLEVTGGSHLWRSPLDPIGGGKEPG
jgi:pteridine reductase